MEEKKVLAINGFIILLIGIVGLVTTLMLKHSFLITVSWGIIFLIWKGLVILKPNQARVFLFLGKYVGSLKQAGFYWVFPFYNSESVSLRFRTTHSAQMKMNDKKGNPIEIAAILVWHVNNSYKAILDVENYESYVSTQIESALRHLASEYAYDNSDNEGQSLRGGGEAITQVFQKELEERMKLAGIKVIEARISHLAYAPEIAGAMLQKQQAEAMIAAREKIVEGAIGMVRSALTSLESQELSYFTDAQKATLISNLLVTLCSDRGASPVINISPDSSY